MLLELNCNRKVIFDKQLHLTKKNYIDRKWEREENTDACILITYIPILNWSCTL